MSKHFFKALETESHEKTLCYCLEMLTLWSYNKITGELPEYVLDAFKVQFIDLEIQLHSQWLIHFYFCTVMLIHIWYIYFRFQKGLNLKSSTQLVKISYLQWLGQCLNKTTISAKNKEAIIPILVKSVEKAIQQPLQVRFKSNYI